MKISVSFKRPNNRSGEMDIISVETDGGKVKKINLVEFRQGKDGTIYDIAPPEVKIFDSSVKP